ncbi:MAG: glycosyl hydrolase 53 family protein [Planctomycetota bacterium]
MTSIDRAITTPLRAHSGHLLGADISMLERLAAQNARFAGGCADRALRMLRDAGFTAARLRLFHAPTGEGAQVNDLAYTRRLARRCAQAGMDILVCIHYSDTWADPGKQHMPRAWQHLDFAALVEEVERYTRRVVAVLNADGCGPTMVQVGNEITGGFLWEAGRISDAHAINDQDWSAEDLVRDRVAWDRFAELVDAGIRGVHRGSDGCADVMLHIDRGGDNTSAVAFFEALEERRVSCDAIGLSYYPFWHGSMDDLAQTIHRLHDRFALPIHVVETAYPHRSHAIYNGGDSSVFEELGITRTRPIDYPLTPEGQRRFVADMLAAMRAHTTEGWTGLWYWAPEWIPVDGYADEADAAPCWARALFDESGSPLPALEEFRRFARETAAPVVTKPARVNGRLKVAGTR